MYHKQLANHVTTKLNDGESREKIQEELIVDGWSIDDIKDAFYYSAYPHKLDHFSFKRALQSRVPTVVMFILLIFVISFAIGSFFIFQNKTLSYTINLPVTPEDNRNEFTYGEQPALSNPDFFKKVKQQFINDSADFVEANLSTMMLRVYKEGNLFLEVPIASKGKEGSWWETPAGLYKINNKEKAHFSGMGHVWMPWSMNFQGNFYLHGRTYKEDGTLSSALFTGGCIRLDTVDAERVYKSIEVGTPLLVFEHRFTSDSFNYENATVPLSANIYMSADLKNNHVFVAKESTKIVPIASLTKLMSALIATEYINLDSTATVPKEAILYTSRPRLHAGDKYTVYQLLFPLLMESSNEAAETIARFYGRESFVKHMNEKAVSIGMPHTHFADASGVSAENTSTAEDLFMLAKYIYINRSFIFNITSGKVKNSAYGSNGFSDLTNLNDFADNEFFFGGKNGKTTAANETNISVFEFPVRSANRPIVTIVLDSPNEAKDAEKLIEYTLNNFR